MNERVVYFYWHLPQSFVLNRLWTTFLKIMVVVQYLFRHGFPRIIFDITIVISYGKILKITKILWVNNDILTCSLWSIFLGNLPSSKYYFLLIKNIWTELCSSSLDKADEILVPHIFKNNAFDSQLKLSISSTGKSMVPKQKNEA